MGILPSDDEEDKNEATQGSEPPEEEQMPDLITTSTDPQDWAAAYWKNQLGSDYSGSQSECCCEKEPEWPNHPRSCYIHPDSERSLQARNKGCTCYSAQDCELHTALAANHPQQTNESVNSPQDLDKALPEKRLRELAQHRSIQQDGWIAVRGHPLKTYVSNSNRLFLEDQPGDEIFDSGHPNHSKLSWVSCYQRNCFTHLQQKLTHEFFPATNLFNLDLKYQKEETEHTQFTVKDNYIVLTPLPSYQLPCGHGKRKWFLCKNDQCDLHAQKKAKDWRIARERGILKTKNDQGSRQ